MRPITLTKTHFSCVLELIPAVRMVEGTISAHPWDGSTIIAVHILNNLLAAGWTPPHLGAAHQSLVADKEVIP